MLSVGAAFASDNVSDVVAAEDEITVDETLAVEEDTSIVGQDTPTSIVINNTNLYDYIDSTGEINANITADELIFDGDFENLNLTVSRPFILTGSNSSLINPNIIIESSNVTFQGFTINQTKGINSIFIGALEEAPISDVTLTDLTIDYVDNMGEVEAIAVCVLNTNDFKLVNSVINYVGNTNSYYVNNAVLISNSNRSIVSGNKFKLSLVASAVGWQQVPAGSGNWVSSVMSEGIVVENSEDALFDDNVVDVSYNAVAGSYDTLYSLDFKNVNDARITNNVITSVGNTYIYGLIISGDNFVIRANNISTTGNYYADGIDIEGPASGVVEENNIEVKSPVTAYGIYSGMNGQNVSANYTENNISGSSYSIFAFSIGDVESTINKNYIDLDGNYTTGIAYRGYKLTAEGNSIILNSSEVGNETIWEAFGVESVGIKVVMGNATLTGNTIATAGKGVFLSGDVRAELEENFINVVAHDDKDAYAIYAEYLNSLIVFNNTVDYQGATKGAGVNNAVYVNNVTNAVITSSKFYLDLVSAYIPWFEIPAGSGNWVSYPISEGIVYVDSEGAVFDGNIVEAKFIDIVGMYDTIYAVDIKDCDDAVVTNNEIDSEGNTYIYGLIISGSDLVIRGNNISTISNYYSNGIDIEGPASGVVEENNISVIALNLAYAIYSGMNGQDVYMNYTGNTIYGDAYFAMGFSLGDVESNLVSNDVTVTGNYSTGVAYRGTALNVENNTIAALGSNVGSESVWEAFGVETIGLKVVLGNSTVVGNTITTTGNYPVSVAGTNATVHDNYLVGVKFTGDDGVKDAASSNVYNNTPIIENKTATSVTITEIDGDCNITGIVKDADGDPIKDAIVTYSLDGDVVGTVTTDENGIFKATGLSNGQVEIVHEGDSYLANASLPITLKDIALARQATSINATDYTTYAIDYSAGERGNYFKVQLLDADGNPLAYKDVKIGFNGKVYNTTTNESGWAQLQINLQKAGTYTFAIVFLGDKYYNSSFTVQKIIVNKKKTTISASAKSFKASAKTKSYTVTLKADKGSSIDGKTYLSSGKKITLKINGKTYTAKTNSKGQATFKLSITKKGKFVTAIKFAGDTMYAASSKSVTITIK